MKSIRIGWKDWVLVCDGARALFLRIDGDAEILNLVLVEHTNSDAGSTRGLGADLHQKKQKRIF
jgi:protein required for attachment to host cells